MSRELEHLVPESQTQTMATTQSGLSIEKKNNISKIKQHVVSYL
jgi:hypothetical protein